jgi:hypothetical protein
MELIRNEVEKIEYYFNQLMFIKNRDLFQDKNKKLHKQLLIKYIQEWKNIPYTVSNRLNIVNNNFIINLFKQRKR